MLRVTDGTGSLTARNDLTRIQLRLLARQREATSGLRINQASDDPAGAAAMMRTDDDAGAVTQCRANASRANGELLAADNALESVSELLGRARELALAMANGTMDASARAEAALEIRGLRDQAIGLANTELDGVHLFAGYETDQDPFDAAGNPVGVISDVRRVLAAPGLAVESSVSGAEAFTAAGGRDIFADLDALATAMAGNDVASVTAGVTTMAQAEAQVTAARAKVGIYSSRLYNIDDMLSTRSVRLQEDRARIADADAVQTLTGLAQAQSALNAALQVSAQMLSKLTLVDKL
jgi:flagellar hook-associated protein 3 FlgL